MILSFGISSSCDHWDILLLLGMFRWLWIVKGPVIYFLAIFCLCRQEHLCLCKGWWFVFGILSDVTNAQWILEFLGLLCICWTRDKLRFIIVTIMLCIVSYLHFVVANCISISNILSLWRGLNFKISDVNFK